MQKVKRTIYHNLHKINTISDISKHVKIPVETLRKKFLREKKIPLPHYIKIWKVQKMKEELLMTDEPCFLICYNAGMREDSGIKLFRKITGMTMQEFRGKYKEKFDLMKNDPSQKPQLRFLLDNAFPQCEAWEELLEPPHP